LFFILVTKLHFFRVIEKGINENRRLLCIINFISFDFNLLNMKYSDFLFWISIGIVFLPIVSQLSFGLKLLKQNKRIYYDWLWGINIALQVILTVVSFLIQGMSFYERALENGWTNPPFNLPPPIISLPISFILGIVLILIIINQLKKTYKK